MEKIVLNFYKEDILYAKIGMTNETMYEILEDTIIDNWMHLSDSFRYEYRNSINLD